MANTHAARVDFGRRAGGDAETTEAWVLVSSSVSVMSPRLRLLVSRQTTRSTERLEYKYSLGPLLGVTLVTFPERVISTKARK